MKLLITILLPVFTAQLETKAQLAVGIEPFFRNSTDRVGSTYGVGICVDFKEDNIFFRSGFSMTMPRVFSGTAKLNAIDSTTIPFNIYVPIEQKVADYILHIGGGAIINPKKKDAYFIATFGLRGILRSINVKYLNSFDNSTYNDEYSDRQPYLPAALNLGFNLGFGYCYKYKHLVLFPNISLGFGSGDNQNKHPWNDFPTYLELGCRILINTSN